MGFRSFYCQIDENERKLGRGRESYIRLVTAQVFDFCKENFSAGEGRLSFYDGEKLIFRLVENETSIIPSFPDSRAYNGRFSRDFARKGRSGLIRGVVRRGRGDDKDKQLSLAMTRLSAKGFFS